MAQNPTSWNLNPTASTADVIPFDSATVPYDSATQPYDGYASGQKPYNWKNATSYTNSLVYPAEQQYYGSPSYVPLYGAPVKWDLNPGIVNLAGQYETSLSGSADIYPFDESLPYDQSGVTFDGMNIQYGLDEYDNPSDTYDGTPGDIYGENYDGVTVEPFYSWKQATYWNPITGGNDF